MSAAARASMMINVRLVVSKLMNGVIRIPAMAAMTLPSTQLTAPTLPTGTAHNDAETGSSETARMERPRRVYFKNAARPNASPSATTMMTIWLAPIGTPAT